MNREDPGEGTFPADSTELISYIVCYITSTDLNERINYYRIVGGVYIYNLLVDCFNFDRIKLKPTMKHNVYEISVLFDGVMEAVEAYMLTLIPTLMFSIWTHSTIAGGLINVWTEISTPHMFSSNYLNGNLGITEQDVVPPNNHAC
jgi:hypothetical protein